MKKKNFKKEMRKRKAVSPVVSTILLIMIVIIIAIIIILWSRNFIKEVILKEVAGNSKRVNEFCNEVRLNPILNDDGSFGITNEGNVPVHAINLKISGSDGSSSTQYIGPLDINPGFSKMIEGYNAADFEEIKIMPILLGERKSGVVEPYSCPENTGIEIK